MSSNEQWVMVGRWEQAGRRSACCVLACARRLDLDLSVLRVLVSIPQRTRRLLVVPEEGLEVGPRLRVAVQVAWLSAVHMCMGV